MASLDDGKPLRVALFTPLPPARTGTADYAASVIPELAKLAQLDVFWKAPHGFSADRYDAVVYQIGNNPHHAAIYRLALEQPGIVVLHEANLHDLIRGLTANQPNAYLAEVLYEIFGEELNSLPKCDSSPTGTQPHAFTMLRRLLSRSKACIVHNRFAESEVRMKGFNGPIACIPHGATIRKLDATPFRHRCGVKDGSPLIGLFGYLRPDKQASECLRVFRELLESIPDARLVVVGHQHPEVPLAQQAKEFGIEDHVRIFGHVPLEEFDGFIAACDVVLNLRWPTFGETWGSMMRAFGLGRTVVVSDIGVGRELGDDICVRIPHDQYEHGVLLKCLKWLLSDRAITEEIGKAAQEWVASTCTWAHTARGYLDFAGSLLNRTAPDGVNHRNSLAFLENYLLEWAPREQDDYLASHQVRLARTLQLTPPGNSEDHILEMGCYLQITPALQRLLGYGHVHGSYLGNGGVDHKITRSQTGDSFTCGIDLFDAELHPFPYPNNYFSTVLCCELLEHLQYDPMGMMSEIYRVLKPGGVLLLTTPNAVALRAVTAVLRGSHPGFYSRYTRPGNQDDRRHSREYAPGEISQLLADAGFVVIHLETGPYGKIVDDFGWVEEILVQRKLATGLRGECIFAVGRKAAIPRNRYPSWLYD